MGLLTRPPDTPESAVAWFLRHDVDPVVTELRAERRRLVVAIDSLWRGRTKAQRYEATRRAHLAARALAIEGGPVARRAAATGVVLEFLWEREYGGSLARYAVEWETLSVGEMAEVVAVLSD